MTVLLRACPSMVYQEQDVTMKEDRAVLEGWYRDFSSRQVPAGAMKNECTSAERTITNKKVSKTVSKGGIT